MNRVLQDLRFAIRGLLKTPTFTIGVVLTLALGIGINATMFGVVDVLFLRPPERVEAPDRIVRLYFRQDFGGAFGAFTSPSISFPAYVDMRDQVPSFDMVAAITTQQMGLGRGKEAVNVSGSAVSWQYFPMLGLKPSLGRFFTAAEDRTGGDRVVVLSHRFWQRQFNGFSGARSRSARERIRSSASHRNGFRESTTRRLTCTCRFIRRPRAT